MKIIEKVGRAGSKKQREEKQKEWDNKYGKGKWSIQYVYKNKIYTREEALEEFYNKSYFIFLKNNPKIVEELRVRAKTLYNPHAEKTTGIDLQVPAVYKALENLGIELQGEERIAIGEYGKDNYPLITKKLNPYRVPLWCDKKDNVEDFWQNNKYLVIEE